jgi:hypothetical protein
VFVCFTPYHMLLAYSIALKEGQGKNNYLFAVQEFAEGELLSGNTPFKNIFSLPGTYTENALKKLLIRRKNASQIKAFVQDRDIQNVYVCNDARLESQTALKYANAKGIYIEDGLAAYVLFSPQSKVTFAAQSSVYVPVLGSSPWIKEMRATFPEYVLPELQRIPVRPVTREDVEKLRSEEFFSTLKIPKDIDFCCVLPHSNSTYSIEPILQQAQDKGFRIAVKYHPRELQRDYLSVEKRKDITVIPQHVPIEMVYLKAQDALKVVVGDVSTALLTAKLLLPDARVVSLSNNIPIFEKIGIEYEI